MNGRPRNDPRHAAQSQERAQLLAFPSLDDFGFQYDQDHPDDDAAKRAFFEASCLQAVGGAEPRTTFVGGTGLAALSAAEAFVASYQEDRSSWVDLYGALGTAPAHDLREIAKVMYGVSLGVPGMDARYYQVTLEFGRRVKQNGNGTDHGSLGPAFVLGGQVIGGLYGNHPDPSPEGLDPQGNFAYSQSPLSPFRATDFRDVYGTLLARWVGLEESTILSSVLLPDPPELDPDAYWLEGNHDFGLGFLPSP